MLAFEVELAVVADSKNQLLTCLALEAVALLVERKLAFRLVLLETTAGLLLLVPRWADRSKLSLALYACKKETLELDWLAQHFHLVNKNLLAVGLVQGQLVVLACIKLLVDLTDCFVAKGEGHKLEQQTFELKKRTAVLVDHYLTESTWAV